MGICPHYDDRDPSGIVTGHGCAAVTPGFSGNGALVIVIDPSRFQNNFENRLDEYCKRVSGAKVGGGFDRVFYSRRT